ncbi:MAG: hypothetical protein GWN84_16475 [Gammaproteobacteria bacterium]|nr:hypothetical protein [Gammaproteobacteria bacterium]NIU05483.1 hypothetical protein [Gammaproteobacteria bacterium]NIV52629.1 hypothetical protein [Gammaproteobacteria bacterium]NIX86756.1 hypothetical protein [Gammaproteobacteria bacterium]
MGTRRLSRFTARPALLGLLAGIVLANGGPAAVAGGMMGTTITAAYVDATIALDPADPAWDAASTATVDLTRFIDFVEETAGTGLEGSAGVVTDMECMMMGQMISRSISVEAVHNGTDIFFRFEWADASADTVVEEPNLFGDALAMEIPYSGTGDTALAMGTPTEPVNIMFWRADLAAPQNIVAGSVGTLQPSPDAQNMARYQSWANGAWTVIVRRPMTTVTDNQINLLRGSDYDVAFAAWDGSDKNRDGRKAISDWHTLSIE